VAGGCVGWRVGCVGDTYLKPSSKVSASRGGIVAVAINESVTGWRRRILVSNYKRRLNVWRGSG